MNTCPFCGAINSLANLRPPSGTNTFMLMSVNTDEGFRIPPDGILVSVKTCNRCGSIYERLCSMNTCPFCGAINSLANLRPPSGTNTFILMAVNTDEGFCIPPDGILVSVKACNRCGSMMFDSDEFIGKKIERD